MQGALGAELEDAGWEGVGGGKVGGVKVDDALVLALVEGGVDVDEFWGGLVVGTIVVCETGTGAHASFC